VEIIFFDLWALPISKKKEFTRPSPPFLRRRSRRI
jgi:hypothetical protein